MLHNKPFKRAIWMTKEGAMTGEDAAVRNGAHYRSMKYRVSRYLGEVIHACIFEYIRPIGIGLGALMVCGVIAAFVYWNEPMSVPELLMLSSCEKSELLKATGPINRNKLGYAERACELEALTRQQTDALKSGASK